MNMNERIKMLPRGAGWHWAMRQEGGSEVHSLKGPMFIPSFAPKIVMDMDRLAECAKEGRFQDQPPHIRKILDAEAVPARRERVRRFVLTGQQYPVDPRPGEVVWHCKACGFRRAGKDRVRPPGCPECYNMEATEKES